MAIEEEAVAMGSLADRIGTSDYHVASRISNEDYKLELAVRELVELGVSEEEIIESVREVVAG